MIIQFLVSILNDMLLGNGKTNIDNDDLTETTRTGSDREGFNEWFFNFCKIHISDF